MAAEELKNRTREFALRAIKLVPALPPGPIGRTIGSQPVRSGTSVGANYRAACRARSKAEFAAKAGIAEEEADESADRLELVVESALLTESRVRPLHAESMELAAIVGSCELTARRGRRQGPAGAKTNHQSTIVDHQ